MSRNTDPSRRVRPEHSGRRPSQPREAHKKTRAAAEAWVVLTRTPRRRKVVITTFVVLGLLLIWALMMTTASVTRAQAMENQMVNLCNLALSDRLSTASGGAVQIVPGADLEIDRLSDGVRLTTRVNTDDGTEQMRCTAYFSEGSKSKIGAVDVYLGR